MATINITDRLQLLKKISELENEIAQLKEFNNCYSSNNDNYIDYDYYKENKYINTLKLQISNLIHHNDNLKIKNRELMQELENIRNIL